MLVKFASKLFFLCLMFSDLGHMLYSVACYNQVNVICTSFTKFYLCHLTAALAQMVACLPLVQRVWGLIPGEVINFHLKIFNLKARRCGDVHFLIARLYITGLD